MQARLAKLSKDAEDTKLDLSDQILSLTRKLESLEEFRMNKEELESKLERLQNKLSNDEAYHKERVRRYNIYIFAKNVSDSYENINLAYSIC